MMKITSLKECDEAAQKMLKVKAELTQLIAKSKNDKMQKLNHQINELDAAINKYGADYQERIFEGGKQVRLGYVTLKLTCSESIDIPDGDYTVEQLEKLGLGCTRTKVAPNKTAMKGLNDAQLKKVGARRMTDSKFSYKLKEAA